MKYILYSFAFTVFISFKGNTATLANIREIDTIYVSAKNDSARITVGKTINRNEVVLREYGTPTYDIYGFMRNDIPKDLFDSSGDHSFIIHLTHDTFPVCKTKHCKENLDRKMITLYDLKDSLKAYIDMNSVRKFRPVIFTKYTSTSFVAKKGLVLIMVEEKNHNYYLRKVDDIFYFYSHGD